MPETDVTSADLRIADSLSRLYAAEFRCPTARLEQAMPWIGRAAARDRAELEQIAREDAEHLVWLAEMIVSRGGYPPPATFATNAAETHYMTLPALLPRMIHAERDLLAYYSKVSPELADDADAARLAARIAGRHSQHMALFESLRTRAA